MEYPLNVNGTVYREEMNLTIEKLSDLTDGGNWTEVIKLLEDGRIFINTCRLPEVNAMGMLYTPLHQAASHKAPKEVFEKLLSFRASRSLKTADGKTAYDIGRENGLDDDILKLIEVPEEITQNAEDINRMEAGLHKVIMKRVKGLLKENSQALPQLGYLYEFGPFHYPVPGWYGGFNVEKHKKGIESTSFCRIMGGSGQRHRIKRSGKVKLKAKGFY